MCWTLLSLAGEFDLSLTLYDSDLLQVHLRRHEDKSLESHERSRDASPPHQGHRDALLRKTNPLWDEHTSDFSLPSPSQIPFIGSTVLRRRAPLSLVDERGLFDAFTHETINILPHLQNVCYPNLVSVARLTLYWRSSVKKGSMKSHLKLLRIFRFQTQTLKGWLLSFR